MKVEIKYMFHVEKTAKSGNKYFEIYTIVTIEGVEMVRKFIHFPLAR